MVKQIPFLPLAMLMIVGCGQETPNAPLKVSRPGFHGHAFMPLPLTVQGPHGDLLAKAEQHIQNGDQEGAIPVLEELLERDPQNRQGLYVVSRLLQDVGYNKAQRKEARAGYALFQKSARYMRQLKAAVPHLSEMETEHYALALYNDACAEALYGSREKALTALEEALKAGFKQLDHMAEDEDLNSLHNEPRFQALVEVLRSM